MLNISFVFPFFHDTSAFRELLKNLSLQFGKKWLPRYAYSRVLTISSGKGGFHRNFPVFGQSVCKLVIRVSENKEARFYFCENIIFFNKMLNLIKQLV